MPLLQDTAYTPSCPVLFAVFIPLHASDCSATFGLDIKTLCCAGFYLWPFALFVFFPAQILDSSGEVSWYGFFKKNVWAKHGGTGL